MLKYSNGVWIYSQLDNSIWAGNNKICQLTLESKEENLHNAQLISAAPDLFEACDRVQAILYSKQELPSVRLILLNALKKAQGGLLWKLE